MITLSRLQTLFTAKPFSQLSATLTAQPLNRLQVLLSAKQFVLSAELTPPRHYKIHSFITNAEKIASYVDVVQVNDNAMAQARLSTLVAAQLLQQSNLEPVIQLTLRHRNRIALQSDLLGFAALGIQNVIVLGGYPCSVGSDPDAKDATDLSVNDTIAALHRLTTRGQLFNGQVIAPPPHFYIGAIATPSTDIAASVAQLVTRVDNGAKYIQLQAVYDLELLQQWMAEVRARGVHQRAHFIAALYPFGGLKSLQQLSQVPGLNIPNALIKRLAQSWDSRAESLKINLELVQGIQAIEGIRGLHLRAIQPRDWIPHISELLRTASQRQLDIQRQAVPINAGH